MNIKRDVGEKAIEFVKDGMIVGLGTGTTAYWAIRKLRDLVKDGLIIKAIPTSRQTEKLARELGIELVSFSDIKKIDITIDGADEIDPDLNLIKGGGGALLREKLVASISDKLIIIADESKYVKQLGPFPLPIEVVPFGWEITTERLKELGCIPKLRLHKNKPIRTDNGNYILDCQFEKITDPNTMNLKINLIPGVVDNGLFINMADIVIIGYSDGSTRTYGE